MSLPSAALRASQVYPTWLPRALGKAKPQTIASCANAERQLPPLQFSASFQSLLDVSHQDKTKNFAFKPPSYQLQQTRALRQREQRRAFSTSPTTQSEIHAKESTKPTWTHPTDASKRPVAVIGAGVIGRRLAALWASTGRPVNLYDSSPFALDSACTYVADSLGAFCAENGTHPGHVHFAPTLEDAVMNAWLVIECVPEDLELKISVLGRIDRHTSNDCIIATNSSNFRSRELVSEVKHRERVLNTLYYIPPQNRCVELMGCGYTSPNLFQFLKHQMEEVNLKPKIVHHESTGLILPRLFGAIKRECLMELESGVCKPEDIDDLFRDFFGAKKGPCEKMDEVGLDQVARTERHFLDDEEWRKGDHGWGHLKWLEQKYVEKGKLGDKTGEGLVAHKAKEAKHKAKNDAGEVWREHAVDLSGM